MKMWVATLKHVIYEKYIWPDNVNMFCEKALLVNIIRSRSLNTCISRELALQKEGNIFVKRMYHLIRIYLSQFEGGGGGGGGIFFIIYVVSFVNRCALHCKLNFYCP